MNHSRIWMGLLLSLTLSAIVGCLLKDDFSHDRQIRRSRPNQLYQVSTIGALQEGVYDGFITCGELKKHGDFGLGTFDKLDGEMVVLDGVVYQCRADGKVIPVSDGTTTPFACVVFYREGTQPPPEMFHGTLADLQALLNRRVLSPNLFYAVRIDGDFADVKVRSVPPQKRPYPRLAEAVKSQKVTELHGVKGTLLGLYCPAYVGGLNVPGWHFHFITNDHASGGHVLEAKVDTALISLNTIEKLTVELPQSSAFLKANLCGDKTKELEKAEK